MRDVAPTGVYGRRRRPQCDRMNRDRDHDVVCRTHIYHFPSVRRRSESHARETSEIAQMETGIEFIETTATALHGYTRGAGPMGDVSVPQPTCSGNTLDLNTPNLATRRGTRKSTFRHYDISQGYPSEMSFYKWILREVHGWGCAPTRRFKRERPRRTG